eukprot:759574-Hanusia_phi.AAC.12
MASTTRSGLSTCRLQTCSRSRQTSELPPDRCGALRQHSDLVVPKTVTLTRAGAGVCQLLVRLSYFLPCSDEMTSLA